MSEPEQELELHPDVAVIVREARRWVPADAVARAGARERIMAAVRMAPPPRRASRPWHWILEPRPLSLSPIGSLAFAAGLMGIGVLVGWSAGLLRPDGHTAAVASAGAPTAVAELAARTSSPGLVQPAASNAVPGSARTVKFVLVAPQASHVSLVGDFNDWQDGATPMTRTPTGGTWTVTLPLRPGRHVYAFVLDGSQWLADPTAPLAPADGLGAPNSVLLVGGSST